MTPLILAGIIQAGTDLINKIWPDRTAQAAERAAATAHLQDIAADAAKRMDEAISASDAAQSTTNTAEAQSPSLFKSGWRPFIGWVCGFGLVYQLIASPLCAWIFDNALKWSKPPILDSNTLMTLLFGMLGLGAYRTYEKKIGVA
jgi:Holin of 3TMs, for gene-transfer release